MPDLPTLAMFSVACLALTATPGPDMLLIASRTVSQGRSAGFSSLAGIQVGTYCHALAAALGLSQLFLIVPLAYDVVRYAGAGYLLYLAWQAFRSTGRVVNQHAPAAPLHPASRMLVQGFLTDLLNPKMALFVLALFPQFVRPETGSMAGQFLVLATVLNLIPMVLCSDRFASLSFVTQCVNPGAARAVLVALKRHAGKVRANGRWYYRPGRKWSRNHDGKQDRDGFFGSKPVP